MKPILIMAVATLAGAGVAPARAEDLQTDSLTFGDPVYSSASISPVIRLYREAAGNQN